MAPEFPLESEEPVGSMGSFLSRLAYSFRRSALMGPQTVPMASAAMTVEAAQVEAAVDR
jgi:hypothetical protein